MNELDSDHLPILVTINDKLIKQIYPKYLDYKNANWSSFRNIINTKLEINNEIETTLDVDNTIDSFTKLIQHSIKKSIPTKKLNKFCQLPQHIIDLIKIRNYHRRKFQQTRNLQYKQLKNHYSRMIKSEIYKFNAEKISNKLKSLNIKDNSLWIAVKI